MAGCGSRQSHSLLLGANMAGAAIGVPPALDVEALLAPFPGTRRVGPDLREDNSAEAPYQRARRMVHAARASEESAIPESPGDPSGLSAQRRNDWQRIQEACEALILGKSKDIEVVAWLVEALLRLHGIAGLKVGLDFAARFLDQYWSEMNHDVDLDNPSAKGRELESLSRICAVRAGHAALLPGMDGMPPLSCATIGQMSKEGRLDEARAAARAAGEAFLRAVLADVRECAVRWGRIDSVVRWRLSEDRQSMDELKLRLAEIETLLIVVSGAFLDESDDDPHIIDIPALLAPIQNGRRAGANLRDDTGEYTPLHELRMLRHAALEFERLWRDSMDSEIRERWLQIKTRCVEILQGTSKDIEVVGFLAEALVKLHGIAGLHTALQFLARFLEAYWDDMHYPDDPDDPEVTKGLVIGHLDDRLGAALMLLPATPHLPGTAAMTFDALQRDQGFGVTNALWGVAVAAAEAGGQDFYEPLFPCIHGARQEWRTISDFMDAKIGLDGPLTYPYRLSSALDDAVRILDRLGGRYHR